MVMTLLTSRQEQFEYSDWICKIFYAFSTGANYSQMTLHMDMISRAPSVDTRLVLYCPHSLRNIQDKLVWVNVESTANVWKWPVARLKLI